MKRKSVRVIKFFTVITLIVFVLVSTSVRTMKRLSPIIESISEEEVRAVTSNAIRDAVGEIITNYKDEQLESITYDENGKISSIQLNQRCVNLIVQKVGIQSQKRLAQLGIRGVDIPIGSLSGFVFLAGKGPTVNIKIIPIGSISVKINSSFVSKGINQTNHKVYLSVNSDVNIVLPGVNNSVSTLAEVLICDTVIVGDVPSTYLGSSTFSFDFVP